MKWIVSRLEVIGAALLVVGACGGCWCMWWRFTRSEFEKQKGEKNKAAFKAVVDSGEAPGILAYANGRPIG